MRGPKPIPLAIRRLQGNTGHRKLRPVPIPLAIVPECPDWLGEYAREHFEHLVPELSRLGLLTMLDYGLLLMLCQAWHDYRVNVTFILATKTNGVYRTSSGHLATLPQVSMANQAAASYRAIGAEFGLSPSSRVRLGDPRYALSLDGADDSDLDPWAS